MTSFLQVPNAFRYRLTNGRVPRCFLDSDGSANWPLIEQFQQGAYREDLVAADVEIQGDRVLSISPAGWDNSEDSPGIDVQAGLIWPCFVDMHTHLDKGHIWSRSPNPDGTFSSALETVKNDSALLWQAEDVYRRAEFGLRCSYAHGTQAIRTHLDSFDDQADISFGVFRQLRKEWADRIRLQAVCLVTLDYFLTPKGEQLADLVAESGGVLGGVALMNGKMNVDIFHQIDRIFELAQERQLDLDFHTDESLDPDDVALHLVAEAAVRHQFTGKITCGHCCSLSVQSALRVQETIAAVKAANISIVSLPMCNLYLQDRQPGEVPVRTPRYRGMTILRELKRAGVTCAIASDNCRDPFFAYGDHDGLEVFTQSARIGHLDHPMGDWPLAITATPAEMMGLENVGFLRAGGPADLVVFKARSFNELMARGQRDRVVIRKGKQIDTTLPDYAELDDLMDD